MQDEERPSNTEAQTFWGSFGGNFSQETFRGHATQGVSTAFR